MRQSIHPPLFTRRRSAGYWAILTNTNHYIQEINVQSYFLNIVICICENGSVARWPSAGEEGGKVALSHLPTFLGVEQKYFYGQLVDQWIVIPEIVGVVVWTSDEKKAPPYMERLHKEHCTYVFAQCRCLDLLVCLFCICQTQPSAFADKWYQRFFWSSAGFLPKLFLYFSSPISSFSDRWYPHLMEFVFLLHCSSIRSEFTHPTHFHAVQWRGSDGNII